MRWASRAKLIPVCLLWMGIGLSPFTGDCFAQQLAEIQNKVIITYSDTINFYQKESNIVRTPVTQPIENVGAHAEDIVYPQDFAGSLPPEAAEDEAIVISLNVVDDDNDPTTGYVDVVLNIPSAGDASAIRVFKYAEGTTTECLKVAGAANLPTIRPADGIPRFAVDEVGRKVRIRVFVGDPQLALIIPASHFWISPTQGTVGSLVELAGAGFKPGERVNISFGTRPSLTTILANSLGRFMGAFVVDTQFYGTTTIMATGLTSGYSLINSFFIQPNLVCFTPASGTVGTLITVSGNGFGSGEMIEVSFGNPFKGYFTADINGAFWWSFAANAQPFGTTPVKIKGLSSNKSILTSFFMLPAITQLTPVAGPVGTPISLCGNGFGQTELVRIDFGKTRSLATAITNGAGVFAATFTADTQPAGTTTVMATGMKVQARSYFYIMPTCDLWVTKTCPAEVYPGATITCQISYGNYLNAAGSVTIVDQLPAGLSYLSDTSGLPLSRLANLLTWQAGRVESGTYPFVLTLRVDETLPGSRSLTNRIEITRPYIPFQGKAGYQEEINPANNRATCTTHVVAADLGISKYGVRKLIGGTETTYQVSYWNYGNIDARDVRIEDTLPQGATFTGSSLGQPQISGNVLSWQIGTVAAGKGGVATIIVWIDNNVGGTIITNRIKIFTSTPENDYTNNESSWPIQVSRAQVRFVILKSGPQVVVNKGEMIYQISFDNRGNTASGSATITDLLPEGVEYLTYTTTFKHTPGTISSEQVSWHFDSIQPYSFGYIELRVRVKEVGTLTNLAVIRSAQDQATSTCTTYSVPPRIDLGIGKWGQAQIVAGQEMVYWLSYWNQENNEATRVEIRDLLPEGLNFVGSEKITYSYAPHSEYGSQTVVNCLPDDPASRTLIWQVGSVGARSWGNQIKLTVKVGTNTRGWLDNVTEISSPVGNDPTPQNNRATFTTEVATPVADLAVGKWAANTAAPNTQFSYRICCSNQGNIAAGSVTITDILPPGVTYLADTSGVIPTFNGSGVIWNIGALPAGSSTWFSLTVNIGTLSHGTKLKNTVTVSSDYAPNDNLANNNFVHTSTVSDPWIDLGVSKWGLWDIRAGEEGTYTISYTNSSYRGNSAAYNVTIQDTLPAGVRYISDTSRLGYTSRLEQGQEIITWVAGTLSCGEYRSFEMRVGVDRNITQTRLTNIVRIEGLGKEAWSRDNQYEYTSQVFIPRVDLKVWMCAPNETVPEQNVEYEIGYENQSNVDAGSVTIKSILPAGVSYLSDTSGITPATYTGSELVVWNMGTMSKGARGEFKVITRVGNMPIGNWLVTRTNIGSPATETTYANNTATTMIRVVAPDVDLEVHKEKESPGGLVPNNTAVYNIWYINNGSVKAEDVQIIDTLPPQVSYASDTSGLLPDNRQANQVIWDIGDLGPKQVKRFKLTVLVGNAAASFSLTNRIEITSRTAEDNLANNQASVTTHVVEPRCDLQVHKSGPKEVAIGQEVSYHISYGNQGNSDANNVALTDTLPQGMSYQGDSSGITPGINGQQINWLIERIPRGCSFNFELRVVAGNVTVSDYITNRIEITNLATDNNLRNNRGSWTSQVVDRRPDVTVKKNSQRPRPGFDKTYYLSFANIGTGEAGDVKIVDSLPIQVVYRYSQPEGEYDSVNHTLTWRLCSLKPDQSGEYRILVNVPADIAINTQIVNTVEIETSSQEKNYRNNRFVLREQVAGSVDPNDKLVSPQKYVGQGQVELSYKIRFENVDTATAAAQIIQVEDRLDLTRFDPATLRPGLIGIGKGTYTLENFDRGSLTFTYDPETGTITWRFDFLSEENGLPPNVTKPDGEGFVSFNITTREGIPSGTEIKNQANIKFDYNPWILTPEAASIVDGDLPTSTVKQLTEYQASSAFVVEWSGTDTAGSKEGAIEEYNVYLCENGGSYTLWIEGTTTISAQFAGTAGNNYGFRSEAIDQAGNIQKSPPAPMVSTTILEGIRIEDGSGQEIGSLSIISGQSLTMYARGYPGTTPVTVDWSIVTGAGSLSGTLGTTTTFRATTVGEYRVSSVIQAGTLTDITGTITVTPATVATITLQALVPGTVTADQSVSYYVWMEDEYGNKLEVTGQASFSTNDPGGTFTANTYNPGQAGTWIIRAGYKGVEGTTSIVVTCGEPVKLELSPATATVISDGSVTYTAWAKDGDENRWVVTQQTTFKVADPVGTMNQNIYYAGKAGAWTIRGVYRQMWLGQAQVTVISGLAAEIRIGTIGTQVAGIPFMVVFEAKDKAGNPYFGHLVLSDITGTLVPTVGTITNGLATVSVTVHQSPVGGTDAITVKANGIEVISNEFLLLANNSLGGTARLEAAVLLRIEPQALGTHAAIHVQKVADTTGGLSESAVKIAGTLYDIRAYDAARNQVGTDSLAGTVTLTISYAEENLKINGFEIRERDLKIYQYDGWQWIPLTSVVDAASNTVSAVITHFSLFMLGGVKYEFAPQLSDVTVYPNPYVPKGEHRGVAGFTFGHPTDVSNRLTEYATIRIFSIAGELVRELEVRPEDKGQKIWEARNEADNKVASGIYIYLITNPQGDKVMGKLAIIR